MVKATQIGAKYWEKTIKLLEEKKVIALPVTS